MAFRRPELPTIRSDRGIEAALLLLPESRVVVAIAGNADTGGSEAMIQTASMIARRFAQ